MEIKRNLYLNQLIRKINNSMVKVITGIKGCGKSYLLNNLFYNYPIQNGIKEDHIISVALGNLENLKLRNPYKLDKYIKDKIVDKNMCFIFDAGAEENLFTHEIPKSHLEVNLHEQRNRIIEQQNQSRYKEETTNEFAC